MLRDGGEAMRCRLAVEGVKINGEACANPLPGQIQASSVDLGVGAVGEGGAAGADPTPTVQHARTHFRQSSIELCASGFVAYCRLCGDRRRVVGWR